MERQGEPRNLATSATQPPPVALTLQVGRPQIRSLSTYGSLGITSLNVLLFIITILLVEPWRRKRLVERVEER